MENESVVSAVKSFAALYQNTHATSMDIPGSAWITMSTVSPNRLHFSSILWATPISNLLFLLHLGKLAHSNLRPCS